MNRSIALVVSLSLFLLAACSSSPAHTKAECFAGTYAVTFAAETSGDPNCGDITAAHPQWTFTVDTAAGTAHGPGPAASANAIEQPGATFDENTCHANYSFAASPDTKGCTAPTVYDYELNFDASGITGAITIQECGNPPLPDGGPSATIANAKCTYPLTGKRL